MDIRLLPIFEMCDNNKRKNYKSDLLDAVVRYRAVGGNCDEKIDLFKYENFCNYDGQVENLYYVFVGTRYIVYSI